MTGDADFAELQIWPSGIDGHVFGVCRVQGCVLCHDTRLKAVLNILPSRLAKCGAFGDFTITFAKAEADHSVHLIG